MRQLITGTVLAGVTLAIVMVLRGWIAPDTTRHDGMAAQAAPGSAGTSVERLVAELAELRASQRQTARLLQSLQTHSGTVADDVHPEVAPRPPEGPPSDAEQHAAEQRMFAQTTLLEDTFEQEATDPQWSDSATAHLRERYAIPELAGVTVDAACKASLCRIELRFPEGTLNGGNASMISSRAPWSGQGFTHVDLATSRATYYLARPDHPLPRISEVAAVP